MQDLTAQVAKVAAGGGDVARAKHVARGKLPPRERVQMLLDPGSLPGCRVYQSSVED